MSTILKLGAKRYLIIYIAAHQRILATASNAIPLVSRLKLAMEYLGHGGRGGRPRGW